VETLLEKAGGEVCVFPGDDGELIRSACFSADSDDLVLDGLSGNWILQAALKSILQRYLSEGNSIIIILTYDHL